MRRGGRLLRGAWRGAALTAVVVIALAAVNMLLLGYGMIYFLESTPRQNPQTIADGLHAASDGFALDEAVAASLLTHGDWLMLIGDEGEVIWSFNLPEDVPMRYSYAQVASFSRWYLKDYPVRVWETPEGLLVTGQPKYTLWKYHWDMPMNQLSFWPVWLSLVIMGNFMVVLTVAILMFRRWQKQRDAARTEWIAGISHDIRTPLALVMGYSESLEESGKLPAEERRLARVICDKSAEISALIADLNLTNRLEYAMEPLSRSRVFLPALLRETAVAFMNADADEKHGIEVVIAPKAAQAWVNGDAALLRRMLSNLLNNAVRHNPGGCAIRLTLSQRRLSKVITVTDDGAGFTKSQLDKLKQNPAGGLPAGEHGLGLRLVREICWAHGGRIRFYNQCEGGGACEIALR